MGYKESYDTSFRVYMPKVVRKWFATSQKSMSSYGVRIHAGGCGSRSTDPCAAWCRCWCHGVEGVG